MKLHRTSSLEASSLRTRFSPKSRIGQGLVSMAPWMDVVLLLILFLLLEGRLVLQPGLVVELPAAPFTDGARPGLVAVIISAGSGSRGGREDMVFFDDERFVMGDSTQMQALKASLLRNMKRREEDVLTIQADRRVPHGTVQEVIQAALDAGARKVNIAADPLTP